MGQEMLPFTCNKAPTAVGDASNISVNSTNKQMIQFDRIYGSFICFSMA